MEAQKDKLPEIKKFLHRGGGYFLYFDAMHPGDGAAHLMCAVAEEISENVNIVLGSVKLSTESTETVAAFFREIKEKYGNPLAGICDMLASNLAAFREVFPGVLLLICHFHFLRALGKDFLEYETIALQNILKQYDVTKRLKGFLKNCKESIEADSQLAVYLTYNEAKYGSSFHILPGIVKAYCKVQWILAYEQELNGYGTPFDHEERIDMGFFGGTFELATIHLPHKMQIPLKIELCDLTKINEKVKTAWDTQIRGMVRDFVIYYANQLSIDNSEGKYFSYCSSDTDNRLYLAQHANSVEE